MAAVAAETAAIAEAALELIDVEYEELPAVLSLDEAIADGAPVIHDEDDIEGTWDPQRNIVAEVAAAAGDVDAAWDDCAVVVETT